MVNLGRVLIACGMIAGSVGAARADSSIAPDDPMAAFGTPMITKDGSQILLLHVSDGGSTDKPGVAIDLDNRQGKRVGGVANWVRGGRMVDDATQVKIDKANAAGLAAATKLRADLDKRKTLVALAEMPSSNDADSPDDYHTKRKVAVTGGDLVVELAADGTLVVTPPGHKPIKRTNASWRTQPSDAQAAKIKKAEEGSGIGCFNPGFLGDVWFDVERKAAVVHIKFSGNDSCWEPDGQYTIVTW